MYKTSSIDFMDFSFKGKKLSDFGFYVGSSDGGFKKYSGLPARETVTDKALKTDIETVFNSYLTSRTFTVPIFTENMKDGDLRKLSAWLNSPKPSPFYFIGDSIYINAMLDSDAFDLETAMGVDGEMELKFICHDPYFYSLSDNVVKITSVASGVEHRFVNNGTMESYPKVTIRATGSVLMRIRDGSRNIYSTTNITNIVSGVIFDTLTSTCTTLTGGEMINNIDEFPLIPPGVYYMELIGTQMNSIEMTFKERYV